MTLRGALPILASFAMLAPAFSVEAQTASATQRARARALFGQGVVFARDGEWEQAVDRFSRTMELTPSPVVAYNLASALESVGRIVEACEHLRSIERFEHVDEQLAAEARALLTTIEPRVARLVVEVESTAAIELDGEPITRAEIGVELPIDPGSHRLSVRVGSGSPRERTIELEPGEHRRVSLDPEIIRDEVLLVTSEPSPQHAVRPEAGAEHRVLDASAESESASVFEQWWFWTLSVAVLAGGVIAVVFLAGSGASDPVQGDLDRPVLRGVVVP
jgi:hypothetical protein